jgi:hypothetical protein
MARYGKKGIKRDKDVDKKVECWGRRKEFEFLGVVKTLGTGQKASKVSVVATPSHPIPR